MIFDPLLQRASLVKSLLHGTEGEPGRVRILGDLVSDVGLRTELKKNRKALIADSSRGYNGEALAPRLIEELSIMAQDLDISNQEHHGEF